VIRLIGRIAATMLCLAAQATLAGAADLNVYSTTAMRGVLEELVPQFQKQSGKILALTFGTATMMAQRIEAGEPADVAILTRASIDSLNKDGKLLPGSDMVVAQSIISVGIKRGGHKPDISTPESLKETLRAAKSIAYSDPATGGASGVHFAKILENMGIAAEMKAKTKHPPAGGNAAALVATGEAELAVQQKPEIMNAAGVDVAGPLPRELNAVTVYAGAITAKGKNPDTAKALLEFLQSPDAVKVFKASGFGTESD
jgi:molybdate transport system substrate-binding protein